MKKSEQLPPPKLAFTKEQVLYIEHAAKMMPYNIDIISAYIYVPHDMIDKAEENLTVQHLRNKFGFIIQSTIDSNLKDVFNPVMQSAPIVKAVEIGEDLPLPKKGQIWVDNRDGIKWYFESVIKDVYHFKFLHSLKNDSKLSASSIQSLVNAGILTKEQR